MLKTNKYPASGLWFPVFVYLARNHNADSLLQKYFDIKYKKQNKKNDFINEY